MSNAAVQAHAAKAREWLSHARTLVNGSPEQAASMYDALSELCKAVEALDAGTVRDAISKPPRQERFTVAQAAQYLNEVDSDRAYRAVQTEEGVAYEVKPLQGSPVGRLTYGYEPISDETLIERAEETWHDRYLRGERR